MWSSDSLAIHASLSNLVGTVSGAVGEDAGCDGFVDDVGGFVFGWPKNAVMEPLAFGFLAASVATSTPFRLRDILLDNLMCDCFYHLEDVRDASSTTSRVELAY